MKTSQKIPAELESRRAFTLFELLVVIGVVVIVICLQVPLWAKATRQSSLGQCSSHLRQLTLAAHIYGSENQERFPEPGSGQWAWDVPITPADAMVRYGAPRSVFYCPANPGQNVDGLWNYNTVFRVIGYATTFPSAPGVASTNINPTLTPPRLAFGPTVAPAERASERVLFADATISPGGQNQSNLRTTYQYYGILGGFPTPHRTAHLERLYPSGGNVAMLDGHVEWRPFERMVPRTIGSSTLTFWW